jgi:hypothetical protein
MGNATVTVRRPTMIYWTSLNGTIFRAESENSDLVGAGDGAFAAPFASNPIVGLDLFKFIDGAEIRQLYRALTARVINSGRTINFAYRCDGPGTRREMSMQLSSDEGFVRYESAVLRETSRKPEIPRSTPHAEIYVAICSFCNNYRFPVGSEVWKELENLLMENGLPDEFQFTHGVCEDCYLAVMSGMEQ